MIVIYGLEQGTPTQQANSQLVIHKWVRAKAWFQSTPETSACSNASKFISNLLNFSGILAFRFPPLRALQGFQ